MQLIEFKDEEGTDYAEDEEKYKFICNIGDDSSVVDVIVSICQHLLKHMNLINETKTYLPNQINQPSEGLSAEYFQKTLESEAFRQELVDDGIKTAIEFIKKPLKTE